MSAPELDLSPQLGRGLLSTMRSLLVLGQLMTESTGERQILELAVTAVPSLARCRAVGIERDGAPTVVQGMDLVGAAGGAVVVGARVRF